MHSEYLRRLYLRNDLAQGRYPVAGSPVRLADLQIPLFVVATERDHVSPWPSVYKIHQLVRAPVSFVLTSGGHNVGIVNPPGGPLAHPQASYRIGAMLQVKRLLTPNNGWHKLRCTEVRGGPPGVPGWRGMARAVLSRHPSGPGVG